MRRWTLKSVLIISCLFVIVLGTALIGFLTYQQFQTIIQEQFALSRVDVLRQVSERISGTNQTISVLSDFYYNNLPLSLLSLPPESFDSEEAHRVVEQLAYLDQMSQKTIEASGISCYYVLSMNSGFSFCSKGDSEAFSIDVFQEELWYSDIMRADGNPVFISTYRSPAPLPKEEAYVYSLARSILDPNTGESIGIFLFNVQESSLSAAYDNDLSENAIYVVDSGGSIVSHQNKDMLGIGFFNMARLNVLLADQPFCSIEKNGVPYLLSTCVNSDYNWTLIEEIPMEEVLAPLTAVQRNIMILDLIVVVVVTLFMALIAVRTARPLHQLCHQLQQVGRSSSTAHFAVNGWAEIREINEECNRMLTRIQSLIDAVKVKEQSKRETELSLLQAQINPHFVYNTLFSIKCLVDMGNQEKALGIIDSFTAILRGTLSAKDPFTTVQEELALLDQYCTLQKYRYGDIFQWQIQSDPSLGGCRILRMMVQPLVENAIFHGISCCDHYGTILITVERVEDNLLIQVSDDGVGIKSEDLEVLKNGDPRTRKERSNFIGLQNIQDRITLYFGNHYGMEIDGKPGLGTTIRLFLPLLSE